MCTTYHVPVALAPGQVATYQVAASLCSRGSLAGKTIQVLLHGITLSHIYWDFPYQPERYSYVDALTGAGYATLNLDRIGVGDSDRPPAVDVTIDSNAFVVYQIVQQLRAGAIGGTAFAKVVLVGHSLGTIIAVIEAAKFGGVDGIVATGFLHSTDGTALASFPTSLIPAQLDPKFSNANLPLGYFTTREGARDIFYNPADTDPQVVVIDEAAKETATEGELQTFEEWFDPTVAQTIHVPIFLVMGEKDAFFCSFTLPCSNASTIVARERLFYSTQGTCLQAFVLAAAGHNINYELNAQNFYAAVRSWTDRYVGGTPAAPPVTCL